MSKALIKALNKMWSHELGPIHKVKRKRDPWRKLLKFVKSHPELSIEECKKLTNFEEVKGNVD